MMPVNILIHINKARLQVICCLVFLLFAGCVETRNNNTPVTIQWDGKKAVGLQISRSSLTDFSKDSVANWLQVQLANTGTSILGEYEVQEDSVLFRPLVAFTRGLQYKVTWRDMLLQQFEIPEDSARKDPEVISIYPSGDSMPVNLLKMYVEFSKPMQEARALENIAVVRNGEDTIPSVFLNLEPELWNRERTILTIWLDPGRTKRDLQPNKTMGSPLQTGSRYEVLIKPGWADAEGATLASYYRKSFVAVGRDNSSPDETKWTIHVPPAGTVEPLKIGLNEQLDYLLLKSAISFVDDKGNMLPGIIETSQQETVLRFTPVHAWVAGEYAVEIEPRLEDLAGNNLERLFDTDLLNEKGDRKLKVYKRVFHIR